MTHKWIASLAFGLLTMAALPAHACVDCWVTKFKQEAVQSGISQPLLDEAFADFEPNHTVIKLDRKQPEGTMGLSEYLRKVISNSRINRAQDELSSNAFAVQSAASQYGVNPEVIVALWGIESNFGDHQGSFEVVESLATLAYEGRRASYFRKELINALKIIDAGNIGLHDMTGSWAGAMGQCQFMPTSYLRFAADGNGDGRKDIWNDQADVFASIASYLSTVGWDATLPILVEAEAAKRFDFSRHLGNDWRSLASWKRLGISVAPDRRLSDATMLKLVRLGKGSHGQLGLVTKNFDTLMNWNRSTYFATAVAKLSDAIGE